MREAIDAMPAHRRISLRIKNRLRPRTASRWLMAYSLESEWVPAFRPGVTNQHLVPIADLVPHEVSSCSCGPHVDLVGWPDGSLTEGLVHHPLDGRA